MSTPLLELQSVKFSYANSEELLLKITNFTLDSGESKGIIGDNGCGKSTIVRLLLGINTPKKGSIVRLFGQEVSWKKHYPSLAYIGDPSYKPEELGLPTNTSVKEVIKSFRGLSANRLDKSLCDDLEVRLGLTDLYNRNAGTLSKGERLRLMVLLALCKKPLLLIADEPTEGLDKKSKKIILSLMREVSQERRFGILWISHRYHEMLTVAHEIYELYKGDLQYVGDGGKFRFELSVNSVKRDNYVSSDDIFETFGEVLIDPLTSELKVTGHRTEQDK